MSLQSMRSAEKNIPVVIAVFACLFVCFLLYLDFAEASPPISEVPVMGGEYQIVKMHHA